MKAHVIGDLEQAVPQVARLGVRVDRVGVKDVVRPSFSRSVSFSDSFAAACSRMALLDFGVRAAPPIG